MASQGAGRDTVETTAPAPPREEIGLPLGTLLKGRYLIQGELARGGFGIVYMALDQELFSRRVVVKVLLERKEGQAWSRRKFRQEIEALARIDHPGVVGALDAGETPAGKLFLVMQFVEGVTLRSVMTKEGMELDRVVRVLRQAASALDAAHEKGVFHRDLKPENIMLQRRADGEEQVKLIDFGIAAVRDPQAPAFEGTTTAAGSLAYMAPEQLMGRPTAASDVYALGVIAYEMATGKLPFQTTSAVQLYRMQTQGLEINPRELRPDLPVAAQGVVQKALSFDPNLRHHRPKDFGRDLFRAFSPSPGWQPGLSGAEPKLGPLVSKMCNRRPQEDGFRGFFLQNIEDRPGAPQIYVIHGEEGECHESLVERLVYWLESFAGAKYGEQKGTLRLKKIPWQYEDAWELRRDRLLSWLFEQFAPRRGFRLEDLSAAAFSQLVSRSGTAVTIIEHDIRAGRWDRDAERLVAAYFAFWGGLKDDPSRPQILVFLNLVYPSMRQQHVWRRALEKLARRRIQGRLSELASTSNCPCVVLNELQPVTRDDVMEWFSLHDVYDSEEARLRTLHQIFESGPEVGTRKTMAEIEVRLRDVHRLFTLQRGYL